MTKLDKTTLNKRTQLWLKILLSLVLVGTFPILSLLCASWLNHKFAYPKSYTWETQEWAIVFFAASLASGLLCALGLVPLLFIERPWTRMVVAFLTLIIPGFTCLLVGYQSAAFGLSVASLAFIATLITASRVPPLSTDNPTSLDY